MQALFYALCIYKQHCLHLLSKHICFSFPLCNLIVSVYYVACELLRCEHNYPFSAATEAQKMCCITSWDWSHFNCVNLEFLKSDVIVVATLYNMLN